MSKALIAQINRGTQYDENLYRSIKNRLKKTDATENI